MILNFYLAQAAWLILFPLMKKEAKNLGRVSSNYLYLKTLSAAG